MHDATCAPIELEQPGPAALRRRFLGYQCRREIEVELANVHIRECTPAGSVNEAARARSLRRAPCIRQKSPEHLIVIDTVPKKRAVKDAFLDRAQLVEDAVAPFLMAARASSRWTPDNVEHKIERQVSRFV